VKTTVALFAEVTVTFVTCSEIVWAVGFLLAATIAVAKAGASWMRSAFAETGILGSMNLVYASVICATSPVTTLVLFEVDADVAGALGEGDTFGVLEVLLHAAARTATLATRASVAP
jgi:hypothetical protein